MTPNQMTDGGEQRGDDHSDFLPGQWADRGGGGKIVAGGVHTLEWGTQVSGGFEFLDEIPLPPLLAGLGYGDLDMSPIRATNRPAPSGAGVEGIQLRLEPAKNDTMRAAGHSARQNSSPKFRSRAITNSGRAICSRRQDDGRAKVHGVRIQSTQDYHASVLQRYLLPSPRGREGSKRGCCLGLL